MRRTRAIALALLLLAAAVLAAPALAKKPRHKPKKPAFTQAVLAGTWGGTWNNERFGTSGNVSLTFGGTGTALTLTVDAGGNVFGCPAPQPVTFTLPKGPDVDHWNAAGFHVAGNSDAFGTFDGVYAYPSGTLVASGKDPACAPGLSFTMTGRFTKTAFSGAATIQLPQNFGGGTARTDISLTRS